MDSRKKFEEFDQEEEGLLRGCYAMNSAGGYVRQDIDARWKTWQAGRASMRDEAANKLYLKAGDEMSVTWRITLACREEVKKIKP